MGLPLRARRAHAAVYSVSATGAHLPTLDSTGHPRALRSTGARLCQEKREVAPNRVFAVHRPLTPNNSLDRVVYQRIWEGGEVRAHKEDSKGSNQKAPPLPRDFSDPGFVREPDVFFPLDSTPHLHLPLPPYTVDFHPWPGGRATLVAVTRGPVFSAMRRGLRSRSSSSLLPGLWPAPGASSAA